jgi:hypothetical protein
MPSKGRPIVSARISEELYDALLDMIESANIYKEGEPYNFCTFIETAIAEKVSKMKRSRGLRGQGAKRCPTRLEDDMDNSKR